MILSFTVSAPVTTTRPKGYPFADSLSLIMFFQIGSRSVSQSETFIPFFLIFSMYASNSAELALNGPSFLRRVPQYIISTSRSSQWLEFTVVRSISQTILPVSILSSDMLPEVSTAMIILPGTDFFDGYIIVVLGASNPWFAAYFLLAAFSTVVFLLCLAYVSDRFAEFILLKKSLSIIS